MRAHRNPLLFPAIFAMASGPSALGQVPYPVDAIQDVAWTSGTHHIAVTQKIISPGAAALPVSISGTADAECRGDKVRRRHIARDYIAYWAQVPGPVFRCTVTPHSLLSSSP